MPRIGVFDTPTKVIDGVATKVDISTWANLTLDSGNLTIFNAAYARERSLWESASSSGNVSTKLIDGNGITWPNPTVYPQIITTSNDNKTYEFTAPYVANVTLANLGTEYNFISTNWTGQFTAERHMFANNISVINGMITPLPGSTLKRQITIIGEDVVQDPEYVVFQEQFLSDPTLTWPGFNGYINGNI